MDGDLVFNDCYASLTEQFTDSSDEDYYSSVATGIFGNPLSPPENPLEEADEVFARLGRGRSRLSGVFAEALRDDAPRYLHETACAAVAASPLALAESHLRIATYCTPADIEEDINALAERTKMALGLSRSQTRSYIRIGIMLSRLPRIAEVLRARAFLPLEYLQAIARCVEPLAEEFLSDVEFGLLSLITPSKDGEVLPGFRTFYNRVQHLVAILDPPVRPKNLDQSTVGDLPVEGIDISSDLHTSYMTAVLDKARAVEFMAALEEIAKAKKCSLPDALTYMVHGTAEVKVCLNLFLPAFGSGPGYMTQTGPLSEIATQGFLEKVSSMRVIGDSTVESYAPTDAQRAFVMARDGTCRFPGCEVTADRCEIDHILEYDHENPEEGGPTDTENLHCLCSRHHLMKTAGLFGVTRYSDSREVYRSVKGGPEAASMPTGPAARLGRLSVAQNLQRSVSSLRAHNEKRKSFMDECMEAVTAAEVREAMADEIKMAVAQAKRAGRIIGRKRAFEDLNGEPEIPEICEYTGVIDEAEHIARMMCDPIFAAGEAAAEAAEVVLDRYAQLLFAEQMEEYEKLQNEENEFYAQAVVSGNFDAVFKPSPDLMDEVIPF